MPLYAAFSLPTDFSKPIQIDLPITKAGVFHYYIEYDASATESADAQLSLNGAPDIAAKGKRIQSRSGAFNVDPILTIPKRSAILSDDSALLDVGKGGKVTSEIINLPTDGLVIQTLVAKFMGTIDQWDQHLDVTRDRGYNMIHFTPLQQSGMSGSPYSIYDQMAFDTALFKDGSKLSTEKKAQIFTDLLAKIRKQWGMLSTTDVVWNHTANNSLWLEDHPEAGPETLSAIYCISLTHFSSGYNMLNSPHLEAAVLLDDALLDFSNQFDSLGFANPISSGDELNKVMAHIKNKILPDLKIWQFYVIDVASEKERFGKAWQSKKAVGEVGADLAGKSRNEVIQLFAEQALNKNWSGLAGRYSAKIENMDEAIAFVAKIVGKSEASVEEAGKEVESILNDLNVNRYNMFNDDVSAILDNTRGRIEYTRLANHGPQIGKITPEYGKTLRSRSNLS